MYRRVILELSEAGINDVEEVGGKNASLGELLKNLSCLGIRIPNDFVITVEAYEQFIGANNLENEIQRLIDLIDFEKVESLRRAALPILQLIRNSKFPTDLSQSIIQVYYELSAAYGQDMTDVVVRSSATAEDLPDASFTGQQMGLFGFMKA